MGAQICSHLKFANVIAVLALFVALGGGAFAVGAISDPTGQIKACYDKAGPGLGHVYLLIERKKCRMGYTRITWNQQGPQGVPGEQGIQGPQGLEGAQGSAGSIEGAAAGGALTGTYPNPALAADSVTSGKILDGTVSAFDIGTDAVAADEIAAGAVGTDEVNNNSLTGTDIDESTLGKVPDADALDGINSTMFLQTGGLAGGELAGTYPNPTIGTVSGLDFAASILPLGGINFGGDTNLYRSAADQLKTDDSFNVLANLLVDGNATLGDTAADTATINAGPVNLPNATSSADALTLGGDANLYRSGADQLRTDDSLNVLADLLIDGNTTVGSNAADTATINAGPLNLPNATSAADGLIFDSDGANPANLYHSAADQLKTDDNFVVTGYLQLKVVAGAPTSGDCTAGNIGYMVFDSTNDRLYVCDGASGWKSTTLL